MKVKAFALAGAGCLALASAATAELVGAKAVNLGDVGAGVNTFRIYLIFNHAADHLLAVNGDSEISPLRFDSTTPLVQNNLFEGTSSFDDVPSAADQGGDSWVVISELETPPDDSGNLVHNTSFSPNFLGGDGMASVIKGKFFEQLDNGGYFDENPGSMALPDENMQILIAQFSLDITPGAGDNSATYIGTASYNLEGGELTSQAFSVTIPSPGALALLGLAGIAGGRRRRG